MKSFIAGLMLASSVVVANASPLGCMSHFLENAPLNFTEPNNGSLHTLTLGENNHHLVVVSWNAGETFPGIWGYRVTETNAGTTEPSIFVNTIASDLSHCGCTIHLDFKTPIHYSYSGICSTLG